MAVSKYRPWSSFWTVREGNPFLIKRFSNSLDFLVSFHEVSTCLSHLAHFILWISIKHLNWRWPWTWTLPSSGWSTRVQQQCHGGHCSRRVAMYQVEHVATCKWMDEFNLDALVLRGRPSHFPRRCNQMNSYISLREEKDIHVFSFWLVIHQTNADALNRLLEKTSVSLACRQISLRLFLPLFACFPLQLGASAFIKRLVDPALRTVSAGQRHLLNK